MAVPVEFSQPSNDGFDEDELAPGTANLISMAAQLARELKQKDSIREQVPEYFRDAFDRAFFVQDFKYMQEELDQKKQLLLDVQKELERRKVKRLADAEEVKSREAPIRRSLSEELELPDEEQIYAIDTLLPVEGNAVFAGRYKAGKTTFNGNLLKSWVDGVPFLGRFQCTPDPERPVVTMFNYEMSEGQFRRWMRQQRIQNTHNVEVVHLRGLSLPMGLPSVREEIAGWLKERNTGLWIVDPASRAMAGLGDGNDNRDVNEFTMHLDEIKHMAGVRDLVLNVHMSHSASQDKDAERALGAQAWSAWGDALWMLTRDKDDNRWFHAYGRDVDEGKMLVAYNADDRSINLVDTDPDRVKRDAVAVAVLRAVQENPGINKRSLRDQTHGLVDCSNKEIDDALIKVLRSGEVVTTNGTNRQVHHWLPEDQPPLPST
jgi:hypothetical protein